MEKDLTRFNFLKKNSCFYLINGSQVTFYYIMGGLMYFKPLSNFAHFFNFHNMRVKAKMAQV